MARLAGLSKAWTAASAALPLGWQLRGLAKGPREADPHISSEDWVAWARPSTATQRPRYVPSTVEGQGRTPEQALNALTRRLREIQHEL
jgi:hypothetical protein